MQLHFWGKFCSIINTPERCNLPFLGELIGENMTRFIGREKELESLKGLLQKKSSSLVVIRGRRRIGKSRLAEEYSASFSKAYIFDRYSPRAWSHCRGTKN